MEDKSLNCAFLQATADGAGYGVNGREVFVSNAAYLTDAVRAQFEDCETEAVVLTDDLPVQKIIGELETFKMVAFQTSKPAAITARSGADVENNPRLAELPTLRADLVRAVSIVAPIFNDEALVVVLKRVEPREKFVRTWHADYFKEPEKRVVTRCLSEHGTLIAMGRVDKSQGQGSLGTGCTVNESGHAGQGIYMMKGDTIHASPDVTRPRWVYVIQPKPSYWD